MSDAAHMREFWDARARENAEYFVDDRLDYSDVDAERFWTQGAEGLDALLQHADVILQPGDEVLDLGCGVGRLTRALAPRVGRVVALDVSGEMLARARTNLVGHDNVSFVQGDGVSLAGVPTASVDGVVSLVVFQHIPDPRVTYGYIRDIGRALAIGGWAAFQVSDDPAVHSRAYPKPPLLKRLLGRTPQGRDDPAWRGSAVTLDGVRQAAADGGMAVEHVTGEGTQFCIVRLGKI